jgi:hypothetical protein
MLPATCAPCGIGKEPIGAATLTVSTGLAETDAAGEGGVAGEDAADEGDAAGEGDAVLLVLGERGVAGLAVVIPALHAATDKPTAQAVTAMAERRYAFIR